MKTVWKRLSALVLALTMVLSLLSASVWAVGEKLTITVGNATAAPGDLVEIPVTVSSGTAEIAGIALTVEFYQGETISDAVKLARTGNELADGENAGHFISLGEGVFKDSFLMPNKGDKKISLLLSDEDKSYVEVKSGDTLFWLNVYAPNAEGAYSIKLGLVDGKATNLCDENSDPIDVEFQAGTLTVSGEAHDHSGSITTVAPKDPIGCQDGNYEYKYCSKCHKYFQTVDDQDVEVEDPSTLIRPGNGEHNWVKDDKKCVAPKERQEGLDYYYCSNNGCNATKTVVIPALKGLMGDVDGDGTVTPLDVQILFKAIITGTLTDEQIALGDIDKDGTVTPLDVQILFKAIITGTLDQL